MGIDHSLIYKQLRLKNIVHRMRLRQIILALDDEGTLSKNRFIDVGCSNGYLTNIISERYKLEEVFGVDHDKENLGIAAESYPNIQFNEIDLNRISANRYGNFDLVTCFETLEHVGNIENAINQVLSLASKSNSLVLISVPIEIGIVGIGKFIAKSLYGYNLTELRTGTTFFSYLWRLVSHKKISIFRHKKEGWGTHYGFDYRDIDEMLTETGCTFSAKNQLTTRIYKIKPNS